MGLRTLLPMGELRGSVALQFVGCSRSMHGFDLILIAPLQLFPCAFFFVLDIGIIFGRFQCSGGGGDYSTVSSNFGVSIRRE